MNKTTIKIKENKANKIVRINETSAKKTNSLLKRVNNIMPDLGKKVMPSDLIEFALQKVTEEDLKTLKVKSLKQTDIDKILYQVFIKKKLGTSKEDFSAFTRTQAYPVFANEHKHEYSA
jgi:hypothetical protein